MKSQLILAAVIAAVLTGCSSVPKTPDVASNIRKSLDQAGYKNVSVSQDREKGVVTLTGNVPADGDKNQAEQIARSMAGNQVVADEIVVLPPGDTSAAKNINADVDNAIDKLVDAALIQNNLHSAVKYSTKAGVVTLTGEVNSEDTRARIQQIAAGIPNVQQVVNEIQVKYQRATASR
jgi:hyperosmotically inducible periplasmic protein